MGKSIIVDSCVSWRPDKRSKKPKNVLCIHEAGLTRKKDSCAKYIGGEVLLERWKRLSPIRKGNLMIPRLFDESLA
jgi:hypothetical protein